MAKVRGLHAAFSMSNWTYAMSEWTYTDKKYAPKGAPVGLPPEDANWDCATTEWPTGLIDDGIAHPVLTCNIWDYDHWRDDEALVFAWRISGVAKKPARVLKAAWPKTESEAGANLPTRTKGGESVISLTRVRATWTLANRKNDKLPYGGVGYIACPDGTFIKENAYEGYGIFGGKDVYELVVDWNKGFLKDAVARASAIRKFIKKSPCYPIYTELAQALDENRDGDCFGIVEKYVLSAWKGGYRYLLTGWKQELGIVIAGGEKENASLPYPIKITNTDHPRKPYADLPPSYTDLPILR